METEQACKDWSEKFSNHSDYETYISNPLQVTSNKQPQGKQAALKPPKRSHPLRQWVLLCKRYLELLKNERGNLAILLLQAPVIALIVFFIIKTSIGVGGFDTNKVVQCPTTQQIFTAKGLPDVPNPYSPAVSTDCNQLENLLKTTVQGQTYAASRGGVDKALQDFIVPGPGNALMILFLMAFAAIMCGCINSSREIVKEDPSVGANEPSILASFPTFSRS